MKTLHKVFLMALVAIFSFGYASADFRFGIKAGLNFNNLNLKAPQHSLEDTDNRTGWQAGVMAEFTLPIINIGMDASLLYARQNIEHNLELENKDYNVLPKDFIDIPVNLKWKIGIPVVGKVISPMILTGPDFLIPLNKNNYKDLFKTKGCEVGWNFGIGLELLSHLQITGNYCLGINNLVETTGLLQTVDLKAKKNYWTVSAAYLF